MRRLILLLALSLLPALSSLGGSLSASSESRDTADFQGLYAKLSQYAAAMETEPVSVKQRECDFLISSCSDSLVRQAVAIWLYSHYIDSKLMGDEAVSIYLTDNWFVPGKVSFHNDLDLMNARIFADFNRQSLIGLPAPSLKLLGLDGSSVVFPSSVKSRSDAPASSSSASDASTSNASGARYSVLWFYAPDCADCKIQSLLLTKLMKEKNYPIDLFLVCTGDDRTMMESFIATYLQFDAPSSRIWYCWDPSMDSAFQMKYGVLQTPSVFLIDPGGIIVGRKLDAEALGTLLDRILSPQEYGSEDSKRLFDTLFTLLSMPETPDSDPPSAAASGFSSSAASVPNTSESQSSRTTKAGRHSEAAKPRARNRISDFDLSVPAPSEEDVRLVADKAASALSTDPRSGRQLAGDLLYYLSSKTGEGYKAGLSYLVDSLILSRPDVWNQPDDSLKIIGLAELEHDLLSRAGLGTYLPRIKVPGTLITARSNRSSSSKTGHFSLRRPGLAYIMFYTHSCPNCAAEMAGIDSLLKQSSLREASLRTSSRRVSILLVDMDSVTSNPDLKKQLLDTFDLSVLPYISQTVRGRVTRKYLTFVR